MLERAKEATRYGKYTYVANTPQDSLTDLVILIDAHQRRHDWPGWRRWRNGCVRNWP